MVSLSFLPFTLFTFIFFLPSSQGKAGSWDLTQKGLDDDLGFLKLSLVEDTTHGEERHIEKVSGEEGIGEVKVLLAEKLRVLLGLKSTNIRRTFGGDAEHGFSPSPSPSEAMEASAPEPVSSVHTHKRSRFPLPHLSLGPPRHALWTRGRDETKARVSKIVIAVVVSVGCTFVIVGLICVLVCKKLRRNHHKRSVRSESPNPSNNIHKEGFDQVPQLFYLSSLRPFSERVVCVKQACETVNVISEEEPVDSPSNEEVECSRGEKSESSHVSCSSVDKIVSIECSSSDDESFHSVCGSHSPNKRLSNASEADLSNPFEISSPSQSSERSSSRDCNFDTKKVNVALSPPPALSSNSESSSSNPAVNSKHDQLKNQFPSPCSLNVESLNSSTSSNCADLNPLPEPSTTSQTAVPTALDFSSPLHSHMHPSNTSASSIKVPLVEPNSIQNSRDTTILRTMQSPRSLNSKSYSPNELTPNRPSQPLATRPVGQGNVPPPPCPPLPPLLPPPFLKKVNSRVPPPPPPALATPFTPIGKDGAPLPKLKPLHWDKVRATSDRSMVWDKLRSSSFELDEEMIESLFGYDLQNSMKNEDVKSKTPSPTKHILEQKRLQNLTILLKALNATAEQVCTALIQGDGLCAQQLEALAKMVLTKEEEENLVNHKGDINELASAERFVKKMLNIPFAFQRIEVMLYRDTFEDEVVHLRRSFAMLEEACKELKSSRLFLKLLEAVLRTGNRMNVGTIRGGARAFKLDALLKLADVKGTDGKTTLLHFVVQEMIRSEGVSVSELDLETNKKTKYKTNEEREEAYRLMGLELVSGLCNELCNVKKTATIDLDVLASSVSYLSEGMIKLQHLVLEDLSLDESNVTFAHSMKSFLNLAQKNIKELKADEDKVLLHVREITEYFHGDVSKDEANPLRIFVIVRDFLGMLDRVCKELRSLKIHNVMPPILPFR